MAMDYEVFAMDNFQSGVKHHLMQWMGFENFHLIVHDVVDPVRCATPDSSDREAFGREARGGRDLPSGGAEQPDLVPGESRWDAQDVHERHDQHPRRGQENQC
eukprot:scaffold143_cov260-Pinguiococcus_pyrenoidosus.AAC.24